MQYRAGYKRRPYAVCEKSTAPVREHPRAQRLEFDAAVLSEIQDFLVTLVDPSGEPPAGLADVFCHKINVHRHLIKSGFRLFP